MLKFDEFRSYGFIASDAGGPDVFMHVNDLVDPKYMARVGVAVEFELEAGDRGPKAAAVRIVGRRDDRSFVQSAVPLDDDALCDVLSVAEYMHEITEALLYKVPSLSGGELVEVRLCLSHLAKHHGWIE